MRKRLNTSIIAVLALVSCSFISVASQVLTDGNPAVINQRIMTTTQAVVLGVVEGMKNVASRKIHISQSGPH